MERIATPALARGKKRRTLIACIATGLFTFVLLLFGLSLLAARIAYGQSDPAAWIMPVSYLSSLLAAAGGGFTAARLRGRQGLICGLLVGVGVLAVSLLCLALFSKEGEADLMRTVTFYPFSFLCATLGGLAGGANKARKPRRRR